MKNSISKFMMIAAAAVALFATAQVKAAAAGGGTSSPTPVEEQAVPAKQAISVMYSCYSGLHSSCTTAAAVPAGMRMVVESINGVVSKSAAAPVYISFTTNLSGVNSTQLFFPTATVSNGSGIDSRFNITTKLYTDVIYPLSISPVADQTFIMMNGYLVKK